MNSFSLAAFLAATVTAAGSGNGDGASNCMDIVLIDDTNGTLNLCYYYKSAEFHGDLNYVTKVAMDTYVEYGFCMGGNVINAAISDNDIAAYDCLKSAGTIDTSSSTQT